MRNQVIATVFALAAAFAITPVSAADNLAAMSGDRDTGGTEILHIYIVDDDAPGNFESPSYDSVAEKIAIEDERKNCDLHGAPAA